MGCLGSINNTVIKIHMDALVLELRKCRALVSCCANDTFHSQFPIVFMVCLLFKSLLLFALQMCFCICYVKAIYHIFLI
jgi:hypothetical protein